MKGQMKAKPKDLIFISQIKGDGSGVMPVPPSYIEAMNTNEFMNDEEYDLRGLSIFHQTYIASGFNTFVVRLKIASIPGQMKKDQ